jgi:hypothetical protein
MAFTSFAAVVLATHHQIETPLFDPDLRLRSPDQANARGPDDVTRV